MKNTVLDQNAILWNRIENYNKARSACIVTKILWIKLNYDFILDSPNLNVHILKSRISKDIQRYQQIYLFEEETVSFLQNLSSSLEILFVRLALFKLLFKFPNWVRRKIFVSLLINNSSTLCGMINMLCRYIVTRIWILLRREIGTFKILANIREA